MTQHETPERTYERVTGYRFARRYAEGKSVAAILMEEADYGTHILADSAESVVAFRRSSTGLEKTAVASNVSHRRADLPALPCPDGSFDVAIALGVIEKLEEPERLVAEAKRALKENGVFVVSTPDKQTHSNDRNYRAPSNKREMYVPEFRGLLERHFEYVDIFRLGSVAGGLVLPGEDLSARIETTDFSSPLSFDAGPASSTLSVMAVCSDLQRPEREVRQPYLLLDRNRSVFEDNEERRADVDLLREEIRRVQETEIQAFQESLNLHGSNNLALRGQVKNQETQIGYLKDQNERLKKRVKDLESLKIHLQNIENSRAWRLLNIYRRLQPWRKP